MIDYNYTDELLGDGTVRSILITDGTVTVNGTSYTVTEQTVTIDNSLLYAESLTLTQSLCSSSQLTFGSCESAELKFTIADNIETLKNKKLKVYIIPNGDASKMLQLGVYKVYEDKLSSDRTKREIKCYDALYEMLNVDVAAWYNTILPNSTSSMTLAQFRASFLNVFNLTAEAITLVNDSITIKRTIEPASLSGAEVIKAICEINGAFGQITNEGKFRFVELAPDLDAGLFPSNTLYPRDDLYPQDINPNVTVVHHNQYIDVKFEDYMAESITQLTIRNDKNDAGVTVGTSGNTYTITGNFLVYGYNATALTSVATNALSKMTNRYYKPCTVDAMGNPTLEVGDGLRIRTTYRGIVTYIMERQLSGIQALKDTYTSKGKQKSDGDLNSTKSQFKQLSGQITNLKVDTDGIAADVTNLDQREASHYSQTSDAIALKVTKTEIVGDLNSEMTSDIVITSNSITFKSSGTLLINTSNLTLDQDGNATFSGDLSGATISTGGRIYAADSNYASIIAPGALSVGYATSGGIDSNHYVSMDGSLGIIIKNGSEDVHIESDRIRIYDGTNNCYLKSDELSVKNAIIGNDLRVDGDITAYTIFGERVSYHAVKDVNDNTIYVLGYD